MVGKRVRRIGPMTITFLETGAHNIFMVVRIETVAAAGFNISILLGHFVHLFTNAKRVSLIPEKLYLLDADNQQNFRIWVCHVKIGQRNWNLFNAAIPAPETWRWFIIVYSRRCSQRFQELYIFLTRLNAVKLIFLPFAHRDLREDLVLLKRGKMPFYNLPSSLLSGTCGIGLPWTRQSQIGKTRIWRRRLSTQNMGVERPSQ